MKTFSAQAMALRSGRGSLRGNVGGLPAATMARDERGSALLEALIAVLLLSFAILGLIAYQGTAISAASESRFRTEAALLAQSMLDDITLNRADAGCFLVAAGNAVPTACTSPAATQRTRAWIDAVSMRLPGAANGLLRPQVEVRNNSEVHITLRWQLPRSDTARNYQIITRLWPETLPN